jgi:uncharacterized membrane protein YvbJ
MICPSCGAENPDDAGQCSSCQYRFRFGHAYNDPARMSLLRWPRATDSTALKIAKYAVLLLLVAIVVVVIVSSLR